MSFRVICFVLLLLSLTTIAHSRVIQLNSLDEHDLISDGVHDHHQIQNQHSNFSNEAYIPSSGTDSCDHQYGFLPCAENVPGYIFNIAMYQGLLIFGEKQIGSGSKVLFNIIGVGKIGGIIFRILVSLPEMMLMIISGIFSSKQDAQSRVSLGVGIYAGMTVFSLTLQWGLCVIYGRRELKQNKSSPDSSQDSNCVPRVKDKLVILKETGVTIDEHTNDAAKIMLLSLIPYIFVQIGKMFNTSSGDHILIPITLVVSSLSLIAYFGYQILNPLVQQRSLEYSKYEIVRKGFLKHIEKQGHLVNEDGKVNINHMRKLFDQADIDDDQSITKKELEDFVVPIFTTGEGNVENSYAVSAIMKKFDKSSDGKISEGEFISGIEEFLTENGTSYSGENESASDMIQEAAEILKQKKDGDDPEEIDRIMSKILKHAEIQLLKGESLITQDGKPNIERIKTLFDQFDTDGNKSLSKSELGQLIGAVNFGHFHIKREDVIKALFRDFDTDNNNTIDEQEFIAALSEHLNKAIRVADTTDKTKVIDQFDKIVWKHEVHHNLALFKSIFQLLLGIAILTFLGDPLTDSILQLSYAFDLPSFSISFIVVPFAMNARATLAAISPVSQKNEKSASLTFSEIYGEVIMNNIAGMTALLAIVQAKGLSWDFSAEVLTILIVCAITGLLAYSSTTYRMWTCLLAFSLYPFSLGLFYFVQVVLTWN